jgi:hypothetical protein
VLRPASPAKNSLREFGSASPSDAALARSRGALAALAPLLATRARGAWAPAKPASTVRPSRGDGGRRKRAELLPDGSRAPNDRAAEPSLAMADTMSRAVH